MVNDNELIFTGVIEYDGGLKRIEIYRSTDPLNVRRFNAWVDDELADDWDGTPEDFAEQYGTELYHSLEDYKTATDYVSVYDVMVLEDE